MELFSDHPTEVAPDIVYHGTVFSKEEADHYFSRLLPSIEWKNDEAFIFGKHYVTKRKVAWYGDESFSYTYSNATKTALPWTDELIELKQTAERLSGFEFNSCLLNLYHDGSEGMAWHSDGEKCLGPTPAIASLSFGAKRKFSFKNKESKATRSLYLDHGSLLTMAGFSQQHWLHRLPPTRQVTGPRINLTFRRMYA